jgi:hypothetical protein
MIKHLMAVSLVGVVVGAATLGSSTACSSSSGSSSSSSGGSSGGSSGSVSGSSGGVGDSGAFDSCSVVTETQAAAALGEMVSAGVLGNATVEGGLACVFYGPSAPTPHVPNTAQGDTVRVAVVEGAEALSFYNDYEMKTMGQPITGYGDQAFYDGYASLSVMKGSYYVRVAVAPAGSPPSLMAEEMLVTAILPALK